MSFEEEEKERMLPVARHELGHYAVARHLGFKPGGVTVSAKLTMAGPGGTSSTDLTRPIDTIDDLRRYCEDRVKLLIAGVLAEAMEDGVVNNDNAILYAKHSGSSDHAKASEHIRILASIDRQGTAVPTEADLNAIYDRLWAEATDLVQRYAPYIEGVADELASKQVKAFQDAVLSEQELERHPLSKHFSGLVHTP